MMAYKLCIYVLHVTAWVVIKEVHNQLWQGLYGYIKGIYYWNLLPPLPFIHYKFPFKRQTNNKKAIIPINKTKIALLLKNKKANHQISIISIT